jgi:rhomboid protease GluP
MSDVDDEDSKALRTGERDARRDDAAAFEDLQARLRELTPHAVATTALLVVNIAVFAVMVASGVHAVNPTVESLIAWGADFGPKTAGGQWWRLLTAMFLHIGVLHLAMNMWALSSLGRLVERMQGTFAFVVVYLLSGWAGNLLSVVIKPYTVSAGASGAIFGVYGALLAVALRPRQSMSVQALRPLRSSAFAFLGFNLWLGVTNAHIDLAAHAGGFGCGLVCGAILNHELTRPARRAARLKTFLLSAVATLLLAAGTWSMKGRVPDLQAALEECDAVEEQVVDAYNAAVEKANQGQLSDEEFADAIERDVLSPWRASRKKLTRFRNLPPELRTVLRQFERYQGLREEGWELIARGSRSGDDAEVQRGKAKQTEAMEAAKHVFEP